MPEPYSVKFEPNIPLMLRDGTITYVDVFRHCSSGRRTTRPGRRRGRAPSTRLGRR